MAWKCYHDKCNSTEIIEECKGKYVSTHIWKNGNIREDHFRWIGGTTEFKCAKCKKPLSYYKMFA